MLGLSTVLRIWVHKLYGGNSAKSGQTYIKFGGASTSPRASKRLAKGGANAQNTTKETAVGHRRRILTVCLFDEGLHAFHA